MSQEKVDRYKEQKANRKQIMKKEKMEKLVWKIGGYLVLLVLVGWIGWSTYGRITGNSSSTTTSATSYVLDTTAIDVYVSSLEAE